MWRIIKVTFTHDQTTTPAPKAKRGVEKESDCCSSRASADKIKAVPFDEILVKVIRGT
jgi:hypothetical protein